MLMSVKLNFKPMLVLIIGGLVVVNSSLEVISKGAKLSIVAVNLSILYEGKSEGEEEKVVIVSWSIG